MLNSRKLTSKPLFNLSVVGVKSKIVYTSVKSAFYFVQTFQRADWLQQFLALQSYVLKLV